MEFEVDDIIPDEIIDHRYFYEMDGVGRCVCGAVRNAVTKQLISHSSDLFTIREALDAMSIWIDNPSTAGFFLRQATIRSIATRGIADLDFRGPIPQKVLRNIPLYDLDKTRVLYIPQAYSHPAFDALLVHLTEVDEGKMPSVHLYPIQVTITERHKNSEQEFFSSCEKWCRRFEDEYEIHVTFIRIDTTGEYTSKVVEEKTQPIRSGLQFINPTYEVIHIPLAMVNEAVWNRYKRAKNKRLRN